MRIIYQSPNDVKQFDIERYYKSLNKYEAVSKEKIQQAIDNLHYDPMHYSVLVELGVKLIEDENKARQYFNDHPLNDEGFERLRRITGYLVGTLERWNDGKRAEERERVKHNVAGVYSQREKAQIEAEKREELTKQQDEYQRGN